MDKNEPPLKALKTLYHSLNDEPFNKEMNISLWSEKIPIKMPK